MCPRSAPKAILFDFGGTLDSNGQTWLDRFLPLYASRGIVFSKDQFARAFYDSDDNLPLRFDLKNMNFRRTLILQVECVLQSLAPSRVHEATAIAEDFLLTSRIHFATAIPLLRTLRGRYRIGIVSNFYGNLESVLSGEGFDGIIDVIADSGRVGCAKPESGIFQWSLDALGVGSQDAWMVGDSLERDMRGAERLGIRHAWLRGSRPAHTVCCSDAVILSKLEDLPSALSRREAAGAVS